MGLVTDKITYNVHDRGRKNRGVDRNFDTVALANLVNGKAVQEKVRLGDMIGYYGHWPRVAFGMATRETGFVDGQVVALPKAVRTVYLSADDNGNITHQTEFLDTAWGKEAEALYRAKVGGFSSAIDALPRTIPSIPTDFHAFDYVDEPNFTGNRGHRALLDAVEAGASREAMLAVLLDAVAADSEAMIARHASLFDSVHSQLVQALDVVERLSAENDLLIGRLASGQAAAVLDDVLGGSARSVQGRVTPDFAKFAGRPLVPLKSLDADKTGRNDDTVMRRLGID